MPHLDVKTWMVWGLPVSVAEFRDDNRAYLAWVSEHPDGFVINIQRSLNPSDARLHQADCRWIRGRPPRGDGFVGAYIKVCSTSLPDLRDWLRSHIGSPVRDCGTCLPAARGHHTGFPVPATSAKHQASVAGADPWHEFDGPEEGKREVRLWANRYIPFEHLNDPQIAARTELRRRIALLSARPGEMLHASYAGPKPADMDVENLLLYNIGGECFRPAARYGVRFELAASHRDAPSGRALGCSYRYRMIEHGEDLADTRALASIGHSAARFGRCPATAENQ